MPRVRVKSPCRIDLFGGTLDLWPLYLWFQPSCTANLAINVFTTAEVELQPTGSSVQVQTKGISPQNASFSFPLLKTTFKDPWTLPLTALSHFFPSASGSVSLTFHSDAPIGSGLAASSSLMISIITALNQACGTGLAPSSLQRLARDLESQILQVPAGEQDYYPALYGGLGLLSLEVGQILHTKISGWTQLFNDELLLVYSGSSHHSGLNNWELFKNIVDGDAHARSALSQLAANSRRGLDALTRHQSSSLKEAIAQDWIIRKNFFPQLTTPKIKEAERLLESAGVSSYKVCGAAGGGCLFALVPDKKRPTLENSFRSAAFDVIACQVASDGVLTT